MSEALEHTLAWYSSNAADYGRKVSGLVPEQLRLFAKQVRAAGTVLDLGCATGRDAALLAKEGFDVHGIDASPGMIEEARRLHPSLKFKVGDVRDLSDHPDQSVHGIWARAILLHMETVQDVRSALGEWARVLHKGAPLHVHVKARGGRPETEFQEDEFTGAARFFRYFTLDELRRFLVETGFVGELHQYNPSSGPRVDWITGILLKE